MAKLRRRGIGIYYRDREAMNNECLRRRIDAMERAYESIWDDAERCIGDHEGSPFWAMMLRCTVELLSPTVRDISDMMHSCTLSALMHWNAGRTAAADIGQWACDKFRAWFYSELLPELDRRCAETDGKLLEELNGFVAGSMRGEGVEPVRLPYLSTDDYRLALRELMTEELLPTVEQKLGDMVPGEIRDSCLPPLRRRRLRRGIDSLFGEAEERRRANCSFISDVLIGEKLELYHANSVLHALGRSMVAEAIYILR